MLVIFFIWQGIVHEELVLKGPTVNCEFYRGVMDRLLKRFQHIRPDMAQLGNWFLQHNNAPSHNTAIDKQFLARKTLPFLDTSPYSPDLAPADYFRFPKVKFSLKGRRFWKY